MGQRLSKWIKTRRTERRARAIAVSPFTIFLLGFALSYWMFHMFTVVTAPVECEHAIMWLDGWADFRSAFQLTGLIIGLCVVIWLVRLMTAKTLNRIEMVSQFIFILGLCGTLLAHKAFLFPFATPTRIQVERVIFLFKDDLRLVEEYDLIEHDLRKGWEYDYPPPPFVREPEHPRRNENNNVRLDKIFIGEDSPTYSDFKRLRICHENYRNAVSKYQRDMQNWEEYWEGFSEEYPDIRLRYSR